MAGSTTKAPPGLTGVGGNGSGWDGNGGRPRPAMPCDTHRLGLFFALAGIGMLFVALTSAFVVRRGLDPAWQPIPMPPLLWLNTAILLAASGALETAKRALNRRRDSAASLAGPLTRRLTVSLVFGVAFLGGQFAAWRLLSAERIYLASSPHSSFFYLLTALHGAHLLGGVAALGYLVWRIRQAPPARLRTESWVEGIALYWHFMGGLWIYLMVLLFAGI